MVKGYLLGLDIGSSSVKASLTDIDSGMCSAAAFYPKTEAAIKSVKMGWAEQDPQDWWDNAILSIKDSMHQIAAKPEDIKAIGISYQMHGLVCVDKDMKVLRDAIIWCDSRAAVYGDNAFKDLGKEKCLQHLLNSPGNFTASKLKWIRENEPDIYGRIYKIMLPGDYIAMRLSGQINTTIEGLSEGIFWDFKQKTTADFLLDYYGISKDILADVVPTFSVQSRVSFQAAEETGLKAGTPVCYRAGDQPNNALSLNVFNPGEIASTAGTSGVVYGVLGEVNYDRQSRVNTFAHVNYSDDLTRLGVLLCINGTGILNSWIKNNVARNISYNDMNDLAGQIPVGCGGVSIIPFGNGAERVLENRQTNCSIHGVNFNVHSYKHLIRAAQEGIVFSFCYGMEIMRQMGMQIKNIHAGNANMFLSPVFRQMLADTGGAVIELYDTDGSAGAAKGAGIGAGIYKDNTQAFGSLKKLQIIEPSAANRQACADAYGRWKDILNNIIKEHKTE